MGERDNVELNHIHVYVQDLSPAVEWFQRICDARLTYRGEEMASLTVGPLQILLDNADEDARITIGFATKDCDADFAAVVAKGGRGDRAADRPALGRASRVPARSR
jgi:catechol 2,3-dioxygenase-like lactoylglutathione lyase family enzyme